MKYTITRRKFLKNTAALITTTAAFPLNTWASQDETPLLRFGLVTDSHYADREPGGTRYYRQSLSKMQECIQLFNKEKLDFVIHLGDFKDQDKGKKEVDTLKYLIDLEQEYAKFEGPRYHCIGNHDVDSITKQQFLANIENTGIPKSKSYYSFKKNKYQFIVLDANFYEDGRDHCYKEKTNWQDTRITPKQLKWLEKTLKKSKYPSVVFCHHPLYPFSDPKNIYYVSNHEVVREVLESSKNILAVFQGHTHKDDHQHLNGIHYTTMLGMVDYDGPENNAYAIVEMYPDERIEVIGFKRIKNKTFS